MANFAVIKNGIIENVIVADSKEIAQEANNGLECIDITENTNCPGIAWSYNGSTFIPPVVEEPTE